MSTGTGRTWCAPHMWGLHFSVSHKCRDAPDPVREASAGHSYSARERPSPASPSASPSSVRNSPHWVPLQRWPSWKPGKQLICGSMCFEALAARGQLGKCAMERSNVGQNCEQQRPCTLLRRAE